MKKRVTYTSKAELAAFLEGTEKLISTGAPELPEFLTTMTPLNSFISRDVLLRMIEDNIQNMEKNLAAELIENDQDIRQFLFDMRQVREWVETRAEENIYIAWTPLDPNVIEARDPDPKL